MKRAVQNPVQRVHAGGCFERNGVQGKNSKSTLLTSIPKKTAQCINTGLSLMGHTGPELCAKNTGNTRLCYETLFILDEHIFYYLIEKINVF